MIDWNEAILEADMRVGPKFKDDPSFVDLSTIDNAPLYLKDLFGKFSQVETIEDSVACKRCNDPKQTMQFHVQKLPPVLIIQLKRFKFESN